ncbi:hypothetical protein [Flavobacterium sp.]|uniref:hypothetical protein n=1 Tax=Flavobacterium sp. TaxID=239 RepID=UPI00375242DD
MKFLYYFLILLVSQFAVSQVGINTLLPQSTLDVNGNLSIKVVNLLGGASGSATPINDGIYISVTPTGGNQEFLLPNATLFPGRTYIIRNVSNSVNAQIYSIGGSFFSKDSNTATPSPLVMNSNSITKTLFIISDGFNWTYFF